MYAKYIKHSLFWKQQMGETSHEFNLSYNRDKKKMDLVQVIKGWHSQK